jgi:hypothetical protein
MARLRLGWVAAERQYLEAGAQLREILGALGQAGVVAIVLKGPLLAAEYYPDPALRPFTDLDLLVRRQDRERALQVLSTLGYRHASPGRSLPYELAHAPAVYLLAASWPSALPVDLHWACITHPGGSGAAELPADELWSRAVPAASWGAMAHTLADEDVLLYLAAHFAVHHTLAGPLWELDLALVLRRHGARLDWDAVVDRARRWRVAGAVYFALAAVRRHLGPSAPDAVMRRLRPARGRVWLVERLQRDGLERLRRLEYIVGLAMLDRARDVARTLAAALVPTPRWLRARYASRTLLGAYAAHYGRIAGILARALPPRRRHDG